MQQRGAGPLFHYLDDYITLGPPGQDGCVNNLAIIRQVCRDTGTPVEEDKSVGPTTTITFLGIELDSVGLTISLPEDKLKNLRKILKTWRGRKAGKKRELLSLIRSLQHASKAVRQGRSFLRRLIDLSMARKGLNDDIRINKSAQSDIRWWCEFAQKWNGTSMLCRFDRLNPTIWVTSDASGNWGCGAYGEEAWFQFQWPPSMLRCHITIKELIPVVLAAAMWGHLWEGKSVRFRCDNVAVVAILRSGTSKDELIMHVMRCLAFITARFNFVVSASHIRGVDNTLADALSRDNAILFHSLYPQALPQATPIPPALVELLLLTKPDWASQHWTRLWSSIFEIR